MNKIKAVIFDMDGVIIDSEPLWKKAEINVFKKYGYHFTNEMCEETKGMRVDEVTHYWKEKLNASFNADTLKEDIISSIILLIKSEGKPLTGLIELLTYLRKVGFKTAIASSSTMQIIEAVVNSLQLNAYFDAIHSAEFEEYGKPHPQVFINTAKMLAVSPYECVVIEDSLNGLIAALAAKMKTIALPCKDEPNLSKFIIANKIAISHHEILQNEWFK